MIKTDSPPALELVHVLVVSIRAVACGQVLLEKIQCNGPPLTLTVSKNEGSNPSATPSDERQLSIG